MGIKLGKFVHVGISVKNIEETLKIYENIFDIKLGKRLVDHRGKKVKEGEIFEVKSKNIGHLKVAILSVGDKTFELLQPVDWPWLSKMMAQKEGIYHIAYAVEDLNDTLKELKKNGIKPMEGAPKTDEIAFVETSNGVMIELIDIEKERKRTGNEMSYY